MLAIATFSSTSLFSQTSCGVVGCSFICSLMVFISYVNCTSVILSLYPFIARLKFATLYSTGSSSRTSMSKILWHVSSTTSFNFYYYCNSWYLSWSSGQASTPGKLSLSLPEFLNVKCVIHTILAHLWSLIAAWVIFEVVLLWCSCSHTSTLWPADVPR